MSVDQPHNLYNTQICCVCQSHLEEASDELQSKNDI